MHGAHLNYSFRSAAGRWTEVERMSWSPLDEVQIIWELSSFGFFLFTESRFSDKKLDFEDVPLSEAIKVMERYYEVDIELATEGLGKCWLNGKYENIALNDLLEAVEFSMELQLDENKGIYRFAGEACQ